MLRLLMAASLAIVAATSAASAQEKQDTIRIIMPMQRSLGFYPVLVGEALGYFDDVNIKVESLPSETNIPYVAFLENGQVDLAMLDPLQTLQAINAGSKVSAVFEVMQRAPEGIAVPAASEVKSVKELKGQTVGLVTDRDLGTLRWAMTTVDDNVDGISTVVVGESGPLLAKAFRDNTVAAVVGGISDWGPIQANGIDIRLITPEEIETVPANTFVASQDRLEELRDPLQRFFSAWVKAAAVAEINPEAVAAICEKTIPEEWENKESAQAWLDTSFTLFKPRTELAGDLQVAAWNDVQDVMVELGDLQAKHDLTPYLNNEFIAGANKFSKEEVAQDAKEWMDANK